METLSEELSEFYEATLRLELKDEHEAVVVYDSISPDLSEETKNLEKNLSIEGRYLMATVSSESFSKFWGYTSTILRVVKLAQATHEISAE